MCILKADAPDGRARCSYHVRKTMTDSLDRLAKSCAEGDAVAVEKYVESIRKDLTAYAQTNEGLMGLLAARNAPLNKAAKKRIEALTVVAQTSALQALHEKHAKKCEELALERQKAALARIESLDKDATPEEAAAAHREFLAADKARTGVQQFLARIPRSFAKLPPTPSVMARIGASRTFKKLDPETQEALQGYIKDMHDQYYAKATGGPSASAKQEYRKLSEALPTLEGDKFQAANDRLTSLEHLIAKGEETKERGRALVISGAEVALSGKTGKVLVKEYQALQAEKEAKRLEHRSQMRQTLRTRSDDSPKRLGLPKTEATLDRMMQEVRDKERATAIRVATSAAQDRPYRSLW